jgi:hypothetical protein
MGAGPVRRTSHGSRPLNGTSSLGSRTWKENFPREQILERDLERDLLSWEIGIAEMFGL